MKEFGAVVYTHIPKEKRQKLDKKANKCVFVGYSDQSKGYRVYNSEKKTVEIARDVTFEKIKLKIEEKDNSESIQMVNCVDDEENSDASSMNEEELSVSNENNSDSYFDADESDADINTNTLCDVTQRNVLDGTLRNRQAENSSDCANLCCAFSVALEEPKSYKEAIKSKDNKQWVEAMNDEYQSLIKNGTWVLVDPPKGQAVIDNRWVFRIKEKPNGEIDRYKARLVVRGFTQCYGIDYTETFSPVVRFTSVRAIFALAAHRGMRVYQFDVKTAFLYGDLKENVYMQQPVGFEDGSNKVCKLIKSLYGLKQASRCWNEKFTYFIKKFEFKVCESDPCVFVRKVGEDTIILAIYVDDGLVAAANEVVIKPLIDYLNEHFEIKTAIANHYLGFEVNQRPDGAIHLSQAAYVRKVLNRFGMQDANAVSTPADGNQHLSLNEGEKVASFPYREAVGSLMYLNIGTRPDIAFAVSLVSRFMERPAEIHVTAVKRILRYIKGTARHGILFEKTNNLSFYAYSDSDFAMDLVQRKSTTGQLGQSIISWASELQKCVALSTAEAEYIAASEASREIIWLQRLLDELIERSQHEKPVLFVDNQSAVKLRFFINEPNI